ncbi:hypothetical protein AKJ65_00490 [candidate division MSBL1 archaeon SCGC-AAA259E19]|uniref:PPC domain-containing protein n=1 Tax=candidate division MSBL1 archaeon SCGC-AAA259E19 TaxID=1698264 RepID=A0A133UNP3_9EURY|nr:hypothetical protein AKJ65_00490 [candidate division MSBL1 archaeon SCGC-AAA259E19]
MTDRTTFNLDKFVIARAEHGEDLIRFIERVAEKRDIKAGTFTAIGALKKATLGFYNQNSHEYQELKIDRPREMVSCIGNISLKEGKPFVHAHVVLADDNGQTIGGHLVEGTVFASEIHLKILEGPKLERKHDEKTDLSLWKYGGDDGTRGQ